MKMLLLVLNQVELQEPLLEALMEGGVHGGTILTSTGMARLLSENEDFPMFGTLRGWLDPQRKESKTIFIALQDEEVERVKEIIRSVLGDFSKPDTAVLFTLPLLDAEGIWTD